MAATSRQPKNSLIEAVKNVDAPVPSFSNDQIIEVIYDEKAPGVHPLGNTGLTYADGTKYFFDAKPLPKKKPPLTVKKPSIKKVPAMKAPEAPPVVTYLTIDKDLAEIFQMLKPSASWKKYIDNVRAELAKKSDCPKNWSFLTPGGAEAQSAARYALDAMVKIERAEDKIKQGIGTQDNADTLAGYKAQCIQLLTGIKVNITPLKANPIDPSKMPKCVGGCKRSRIECDNQNQWGGKATFDIPSQPTKFICNKCLTGAMQSGKAPWNTCSQCGNADHESKLHSCVHHENINFCTSCMEQHKASTPACADVDTTMPWVARGMKVQYYVEDNTLAPLKNWGFVSQNIDPVRTACDYYILLVIRDALYEHPDMTLHGFNGEAAERLAEMVAEIDPVFVAYTDMVVGGELRYHGGTIAGGLRRTRHQSWNAWKRIRQEQGPQALLDAAVLFRRIKAGKSVGGEKWAVIAETLYARVTGQISPELFLDRVFNLQHNGGTVLNKVEWAGNPYDLQKFVGPWHASDPPRIDALSAFASSGVNRLLWEYLEALRKERYYHRMPPLPGTIRAMPMTEGMKNIAKEYGMNKQKSLYLFLKQNPYMKGHWK